MSNAYERAGVNLAAGNQVVEALKQKLNRQDSHVLGTLGGFAGCYELDEAQRQKPVLVAGSDGVGTKVLLASQANKVANIGQDLIGMCVNDLLAQGALPLFFLDYLALASVEPAQVEIILDNILAVCQANGLVLLGGETAEMPGVYQPGHFDLAGFAVGLADRQQLYQPQNVQAGDILIGLPASGLHSNGFSLVRKILFQDHHYQYTDHFSDLSGSLIEELLIPTKLYVSAMQPLITQHLLTGAAHITGGGLLENVARMLPKGLQAEIDLETWQPPTLFKLLIELGELSKVERYETFNMGIGMVLAVPPKNLAAVEAALKAEPYYQIGSVKTTDQPQPVKLMGDNHG